MKRVIVANRAVRANTSPADDLRYLNKLVDSVENFLSKEYEMKTNCRLEGTSIVAEYENEDQEIYEFTFGKDELGSLTGDSSKDTKSIAKEIHDYFG